MRGLYVSATVIFWLLVGACWLAARSLPPVAGSATGDERAVGTSELARHARADDCWMAINGEVVDLTTYLPEHPSPLSVVVPWCGKEASAAYATKGKGRPHSAYADALLTRYRIGTYTGERR